MNFSRSCALLFFLFSFLKVSAQKDTLKLNKLETVMITAYKAKPLKELTTNISALQIDSLSLKGNYSLAEILTQNPGVEILTTGPIKKPVIRGLSGNRILILLNGLKFKNQQWQEEHGFGLADFGVSTVEVVKGPLSVLYGSDAMGGVLNILDLKKPKQNSFLADAGLQFNINTLGGMMQAGYRENNQINWWSVRLGIENNADYSDGNYNRVLNTRNDGYYLKGSYGFKRTNWTSNNTFSSSFTRSGFIFNDAMDFIEPDARWSRKLDENPAHLVLLNLFSSENDFRLKDDSTLELNLGVHSNRRMENEGGGKISLDMHLLNLQYMLKWEKHFSRSQKLILANNTSFEDNTNYGARKLVPDAHLQESTISGMLESTISDELILENGIGVGEKYIKTFFTPSLNGEEQEAKPFTKFSFYYNFHSGLAFNPNDNWNAKLNISSGVRVPNLAELSSNGLHEGIFIYEIGDEDLENERNYAANLDVSFHEENFGFFVSPFYNIFKDFVYLAPTDEEFFGFPVSRYRQQDAEQYGTEAGMNLNFVNWQNRLVYSGMISKTKDGNYTPYLPAQRLKYFSDYAFHPKGLKSFNIFSEFNYAFQQNKTAPNEIATDSYLLVKFGANTSFTDDHQRHYQIGVSANNLLNESYYDHLSRFKNYGLLNMGRNIMFTLKVDLAGATHS